MNPSTSVENEIDYIGDGMSRIDIAEDDEESLANSYCVKSKYPEQDDASFKNIHLNLQKEAIIDLWQDASPRFRVSVQFLVESGCFAYEQLQVHVSSCGYFLEISKPISPCITDVEKALITPKLDSEDLDHKEKLIGILENHTRYVARKASIQKLNESIGRDKHPRFRWNIRLPFRCRPELVTKNEDVWFNGIQYVEFSSGEIWCFVELVKKSKEAYVQKETSRSMHMIREDKDEEEEEYTLYEEEEEVEDIYEDAMDEDEEGMQEDEGERFKSFFDDDSTIAEKDENAIPSIIQADLSDPQPTVADSFHTAANVSPIQHSVAEYPKNSSASLSAITPTQTFVSNIEGGTNSSRKSIRSVPVSSNSRYKLRARSVASMKRIQSFDQARKKVPNELHDVKQVLNSKFPALKKLSADIDDSSTTNSFLTLPDDSVKVLRISNGNDNFSVVKSERSRTPLQKRNPFLNQKRKKGDSTSSQSGSSNSSSTVLTKNTRATRVTNVTKGTKGTKEGQGETALVVRRSNRNLRSSSKKTRTDETI